MQRASVIATGIVLFLLGVWTSSVAVGQKGPWGLQGSFGLTAASFSKRVADTAGSIGVHLGFAPRLYGVLASQIEGTIEYLGPVCFDAGKACEAEHSRSASSETFMVSGSVAVGMLTPPLYLGTQSEGVEVAVGVLAGQAWVEAGFGRDACINCRLSRVDLRGGFFLEPTLELWFFPDVALGVSYRLYSTASDLHRRLTVRFVARRVD